jgi:hypothetical protein
MQRKASLWERVRTSHFALVCDRSAEVPVIKQIVVFSTTNEWR